MGDYEKALPLYKRALDISEKVLGPQHPSVATTLNNLAALYKSMGDYEKHFHFIKGHLKLVKRYSDPNIRLLQQP